MRTAFLFPGQGSQFEGMLDFLPNEPCVKYLLEQSSDILQQTVSSLHSKEALATTKAVQQCLLISSVATYKLFEIEGLIPSFVAGHSVGAFGAAVAACVLTFEEALRLVTLRGELMEQICSDGFGMGVVLGMNEHELLEVTEQFFHVHDPVYVSNRNAPFQITISGSLKGLEKVISYVSAHGAKSASLLNVSTPSHCPLFQDVSNQMLDALNKIELKRPKIPISSNLNARLLKTTEAIKRDLAESICHPVRWHDATSVLYENGARLFIEMPPGDVLTKLATSAFQDVRSMSVSKNGIEDCLFLLQN
ncbi:malonate decarboxylase subunit epsilon [Lysinibacillus agricola]|uniref:Malonyl CoA-acyl carrier protein transacylase n=1 Tax=Lysinibacillus agricola TaxID=2590012 RepID=A0ABX7AX88_9BACI|nr:MULTISPECIES: malonate decarboxylase subunit epsilon [Lysinibacillus]KOS62924.1 malonate decarboxylase subunit epsilon [Lysinibacillus sp. FJAT-14222]QQP13892.1 malonate decarboxylase subunit epsilon [Lysinibacillus agricola]